MKFNLQSLELSSSSNKLKVQLFHGHFRNCALLLQGWRDIEYYCTAEVTRYWIPLYCRGDEILNTIVLQRWRDIEYHCAAEVTRYWIPLYCRGDEILNTIVLKRWRDIEYHCTAQIKRRDTCYVCTYTETRGGGVHDKVYVLQRAWGEVHNIFYVLQLQREGEG